MDDNLAAVDQRQLQNQEDGGSCLDSELTVVAENETNAMAIAETAEIPPASGNGEDALAKNDAHQTETSLRGPTGPRSLRGKQKTRLNATKHGIFAVGIISSRESESDYFQIVEDLSASIQPAGRLEELLVEKLAMLMWRYRRLLQAEAGEAASQTTNCKNAYIQHKIDTTDAAKKVQGLINAAVRGYNEVALEAAIRSLKLIRQRITKMGLDWERDRQLLTEVFGPLLEKGNKITITADVTYNGKVYKVLDRDLERIACVKYERLTRSGEDPQKGNEVQSGAAELIVKMFTEEIDRFELMLLEWREQGDDGNELEETRWLVPSKEASDRLQRYEGSLERSFDRTLSQIERLQRMRTGQPVLPAIKLDISH